MKSCGWELHVAERVTSEHSCFHCGAKAGPVSCADSKKPAVEQGTPHSFKTIISPIGHTDVNFNTLYLQCHNLICGSQFGTENKYFQNKHPLVLAASFLHYSSLTSPHSLSTSMFNSIFVMPFPKLSQIA